MTKAAPHRPVLVPSLLCFVAILLGTLLPARHASAGGRVALLPFTANAQDARHLVGPTRDLLASRLAAELGLTVIDRSMTDKSSVNTNQPETLIKLGKALQVDYVVAGSMTPLGTSLSLDAKVFDIVRNTHQSFYATAKSENEIIPAIDNLVLDIGEKMFGRPPRPEAAQTPSISPNANQQPQYTTAHPDKAFAGRGGMRGGSPFVYPGGLTSEFQKSQNMKLSLQSMDMADLDGDGQPEIILADRESIQIFKRNDNRLSKVGQIPGQPGFAIHAISVADLNHNGKPEIYVSAADHQTPSSFAFEWGGSDKANYLFQNAHWYVRAVQVPGEGMVLAGQKADTDRAVRPGIYRLETKGSALTAGSRLDVPDSVNLFEFTIADLDNDGSKEIIAIDQYDRLQVLRSSGTVLWKSDDYYGGTTRYIGGKPTLNMAQTARTEDDLGRIYIPSRIVVADVNGDGTQDVIINKNLSTASRLFTNMKNYPSGEIHALTWNGLGLTELWRTRKIDGTVMDYLLQPTQDKKRAELLVGILLGSNPLDAFSEATATVLMYQLDTQPKPVRQQ